MGIGAKGGDKDRKNQKDGSRQSDGMEEVEKGREKSQRLQLKFSKSGGGEGTYGHTYTCMYGWSYIWN
jgi:hypothetical protein